MGSGASRALQQMTLTAPPRLVYATGPELPLHENDILLDDSFWESSGLYVIKDSHGYPLVKVADVKKGFRPGPLLYDLDGDLVLSVKDGTDGYTRYELYPANGMTGISTFQLIPETTDNQYLELLCRAGNGAFTTYLKMLSDGTHQYIFCGDPKNANMIAKVLTVAFQPTTDVPVETTHPVQLLKTAPQVDIGLMVAMVMCYNQLSKAQILSRTTSKMGSMNLSMKKVASFVLTPRARSPQSPKPTSPK